MSINIREALTFDDVLLEPKFSTIKSRSEVNLDVVLSKGLKFKVPVLPANMKTISGFETALAMYNLGGMAIVNRFISIEEQFKIARYFSEQVDGLNYVGFSIGVKKEDYENVNKFVKMGIKIICIDIAHADSQICLNMVKYINDRYPNVFLIAGTVATADGTKRLFEAGADCIRVNIGGGSICSTRIMTANGIPQLTALTDCWEAKCKIAFNSDKKLFIMADGGCKSSGDLVKSLCFADLVLTGNLFAGATETPGEIKEIGGKKYKAYVGSSTHRTSGVEGYEALVPAKGSIKEIMEKLSGGIRSGLSYQGAYNLEELKRNPMFVKVSAVGHRENGAHDVIPLTDGQGGKIDFKL